MTTVTTVTTPGMIILFYFFCRIFAGLGVGSFHTKRKAEAIMKVKGWLSASEGSFNEMWKEIKGRF